MTKNPRNKIITNIPALFMCGIQKVVNNVSKGVTYYENNLDLDLLLVVLNNLIKFCKVCIAFVLQYEDKNKY